MITEERFNWVETTKFDSTCLAPVSKDQKCGQEIAKGTKGPFVLHVAKLDKEGRRTAPNRLYCKKHSEVLVKNKIVQPFTEIVERREADFKRFGVTG
jgi:hypothetical protein